MRVVCQQPHYLPWLGYFELFTQADAFVFLDSVQWIRQGRQHRTKIYSPSQEPRWLTVPVKGHGHREKTLKDMQVDTEAPWARDHWRLIEETYRHAPRFRDQVEPLLRPFLEKAQKEKFLIDISQESLWLFWEGLDLKSEIHWASEMPLQREMPAEIPAQPEGANERLIGLCQALGADEYYSSLGSTRYIDLSVFREHGLRVRWQHFRAIFPGEPLRSADLSAIDWLAHHDWSVLRAAIAPRSGFRSELPEQPGNTAAPGATI